MSTSIVTISNDVHGTFTVPADSLAIMVTALHGDVNYSGLALKGFVSELTEINYFDVDLLTIAAVLIDFGMTTSGMALFLAEVEDSWITSTYDRFVKEVV